MGNLLHYRSGERRPEKGLHAYRPGTRSQGPVYAGLRRERLPREGIYLILSTERYAYLIYSWNYGVELVELIGQPKEYALPEIKRCITEALLQDDRITSVDGFEFETGKKTVHVTFTVHSIFGDLEVETDV